MLFLNLQMLVLWKKKDYFNDFLSSDKPSIWFHWEKNKQTKKQNKTKQNKKEQVNIIYSEMLLYNVFSKNINSASLTNTTI